MMIVRAVKTEDFKGINHCAQAAGIGITNLPKNEPVLKKHIQKAVDSFNKDVQHPNKEEYLFVLHDTETNEIGGTSGLHAKIGMDTPFYTFEVKQEEASAVPTRENKILELKSYVNGPTEVCALYLLSEYRHGGWGRLLSLSRFLFISLFPERFEDKIIANMRGLVDDGYAPFWNGCGRHFYPASYEEIMKKRATSEAFFKDFLPKHPIYVTLLAEDAQEAIAKTHPHTLPAIEMLQHQGFQSLDEIDPIDGGPILIAETKKIKTVKECKQALISGYHKGSNESKKTILCNESIDFRACYGSVQQTKGDTVTIEEDVAKGLQLRIGETIRYVGLQ